MTVSDSTTFAVPAVEPNLVVAAKPWEALGPDETQRAPRPPWKDRLLPVIGPLVVFLVWDLVVRFGLIKAILLPTPWATLQALVTGLAGGPLLTDFLVTVMRTLESFLIAAVVGVPLGVLLGSNEKAYRSVEFLIDFFRSTPSSALIPLFLLIFACPTSTRSPSRRSARCCSCCSTAHTE